MRKLLYLLAGGMLAAGFVACDNEPKNPGDFSVASELSLGNVVSQVDGKVYTLKVAQAFDSVFGSNVTVWDTVYNANGDFESRSSRSVWVPSKFTTRYVEYEPIMLPSDAQTFAIDIYTNAKWVSPQPTKPRGGSQFYNDATTGGGGDGTLIFRSEINENKTRTVSAQMNIYTQDSTVYHKVNLLQEGLDN